jgi:putative DNA primase/helicase
MTRTGITNNQKIGLEVYVAGYTNRFVTVTGNHIRGSDLEERSEALAEVLDKYMKKTNKPKTALITPGSYLSDESVLEKAAYPNSS